MTQFRARPSVHAKGGLASRETVYRGARGAVLHADVVIDDLEVEARELIIALVPLAVGRILLRTSEGISAKGDTFRPYSQQHAARRAAKGLQTAPVDLRMTGRLLTSIGYRGVQVLGDGSFVVTIAPDATQMLKAKALERDGRPFVDLTQRDMDEIAKALEARGIPVRVTRVRS